MIVSVSLQVAEGSEFATDLPSGSAFSVALFDNFWGLIGSILTFQIAGFDGLLMALCFYLPTIPIVVWLMLLVYDLILALASKSII